MKLNWNNKAPILLKHMCPDLEPIQRFMLGFLREIIPRSTKHEVYKNKNCLQRMSIERLVNHEQIRNRSFPLFSIGTHLF